MKRIALVVAAVAGFSSAPVVAQPLMKYNYLDVAYQWNSANGVSTVHSTNGVDTKLSVSLIEHFALEGGYTYAKGDASKSYEQEVGATYNYFEFNTYSYGVLGYYRIKDGLDLLARVGGNHYNEALTMNGKSLTAAGQDRVYSGIGARYLATDDLEIDGNILYQNQDAAVWTYSATALYSVLKNIALKAETAIDNESNVIVTAGVRLAM